MYCSTIKPQMRSILKCISEHLRPKARRVSYSDVDGTSALIEVYKYKDGCDYAWISYAPGVEKFRISTFMGTNSVDPADPLFLDKICEHLSA